MTASTEPGFVAPQRAAKAEKIVRVLRDVLGMDAEQAAHMSPRQRHEVEQLTGVRKGSAATWRLVVEMLAGSAMPNALCPTCGHGNPAGEDGPPLTFGHDGECRR